MFEVFSKAVYEQYNTMVRNELFVTDVIEPFKKYLTFFPEGTNPIYRVRTVYDCQCCKQFITRLGCLVGIKGDKLVTVWDTCDTLPEPYKTVARGMRDLVSKANIVTVFRTKEDHYGLVYNYDTQNNERHDHFYGACQSSSNADTQRGEKKTIFAVMKRGLAEIKADDLYTVIDLIDANELYRGLEHREAVLGFRGLQMDYHNAGKSDLFIWANLDSRSVGNRWKRRVSDGESH